MDKPTRSRIVHFVLPAGPNAGQHRTAVVLEPCAQSLNGVPYIDLQVMLTDSDGGAGLAGRGQIREVRCVQPDHVTRAVGTWHWPERE